MINLRPAKSVQGAVTLPVSPDLLFMAALGACATGRKITAAGVAETGVVKEITRSLSGHASVDIRDGVMTVAPAPADADPAILLALPGQLLPYRMIYLFMGLGMGKTVVIKSAPEKLLDNYIAQAKRTGITVEKINIEQSAGLRATYFDGGIAESACPDEDDCAALLAFLFGKSGKLSFTIADYYLSTPLRQMAPAFGLTLNVKQIYDDDPLAKRVKFLKGKRRDAQTHSQRFAVDADFTRARDTDTPALNIDIPGDEILAAALAALKCLTPKGNLEISNAPLETWGAQTIAFIKKMGGKINVREEAKSSFGARGTVTVQKSGCAGRKLRCVPIYQFIGQLPCMAVAAAFAEGKSVFRELAHMRLSDPDGLDELERSLRPLGVRHGEMPDGIVVEGAKEYDGFDILEPLPAHTAIAFCIAGLKCVGKTSVSNENIFARWPGFEDMINEICEFRNK